MLENKIRNNKSNLVVNYNNSGDHITDYFIDTLPCDVRKNVYKRYPCVIVKYRHQNKVLTSSMITCNKFNHFLTNNQLKHSRRCDLCLEQQNILRTAIDANTDAVRLGLSRCQH